jgi:colicin import membrane protein
MTSLRLKRKKDDGISLNSMVLLSFLLHALVLSILILSPSWPTPKWTFGPVYTVDLVSMSAPDRGDMTSAVASDVGTRNRPVVLKKQVGTLPSEPIYPVKTSKKDVSGELDKVIENIRNRTATSPGDARPRSSGGNVEMTMKMRVFYSVIWSRIREQWALPEEILPSEAYEAVIAVTILRNGALADLAFEKKSGNEYFDESALKAIKKATPFPALPEWFMESSLEIGIRFRSSELR